MTAELHPPLGIPKNGQMYEILSVCRVSDPAPGKQNWEVLNDQEASYKEWLTPNVTGKYRMTTIAGSGSGELLDRKEYTELLEEIATGKYDLVLCEDLGRIVRRIHAHLVCELCEDFNTRLYSKIDHLDTALPNWREASIFAAFHHERSNRDTSERIKRTQRNRFINGGSVRKPPYGWLKPEGAKNDAALQKAPLAEGVYKEWFRMLDEDEASFMDVVRFLKTKEVKFYSRYKDKLVDPTCASVARHTFNPLLKGLRERNRRKTRRVNATGNYVSIKALPQELLQRQVPHLAFFSEAYFDRVTAKVRDRNAIYRRSENPADDPCLNRPKKGTRYPGDVTYCGICGRLFVWGGHGVTDHLMCNGAREHRCWNGATFDGTIAAQRIGAAALDRVSVVKDFDSVFNDKVNEEAQRLDEDRLQKLDDLRRQSAEVQTKIANLVAFIAAGKAVPSLSDELDRLEKRKAMLKAELDYVEQQPTNTISIPSAAEIRKLAEASLKGLAPDSPDFRMVMRKLVPKIVVFPVRLCDGGPVVLRATFRLHLSSLLPDRRTADTLRGPLEQVVTIDLFDKPQRERFRQQVLAARAAGKTEAEAAHECGITVTAAQRAAVLQRQMDALRITDPYVPVTEPPEDCTKLRRHKHPEYRFGPLPGAGQL